MAKWYGKIGYAETMIEDPPGSGIWVEKPIVKEYYGDLIKNTRRLQSTDQLNQNITISNEISIISDQFANQNFHSMRYAEHMGTKWCITNVDASQYPRLVLSLGGEYHD